MSINVAPCITASLSLSSCLSLSVLASPSLPSCFGNFLLPSRSLNSVSRSLILYSFLHYLFFLKKKKMLLLFLVPSFFSVLLFSLTHSSLFRFSFSLTFSNSLANILSLDTLRSYYLALRWAKCTHIPIKRRIILPWDFFVLRDSLWARQSTVLQYR